MELICNLLGKLVFLLLFGYFISKVILNVGF